MRRTFTHGLWIVALFVALAAPLAYAGVSASISGTVADPTGAVIPGASVVAHNTDTGIDSPTQTNAQGFYNFPALPTGHYEVRITAKGFEEFRETGLVLDVNTALRVDAVMRVGSVSQAVSVSSTAVHVETSSTQMGEVIGTNKMTSLPLNGRSYTDLLALQPGVAPASSGEGSGMAVSGNLNPGGVSVSGQREGANGFIVNGGNAEERLYNNTAIIPNLDSIAEFRILTNNSDAEYGNYSGGMINVITKSGTNQFHGDAFDFIRNPHLDARNFYSPTEAVLHQNQFGGTAGGPILHDKLFFFTDYQGTRMVNGLDSGVISTPSAQDQTGNLSDVASLLTGTVNGTAWANTLTQNLGYPVTSGEAYYTPGCTTNTQCVLPNATIPQSAFSAPAKADAKFIPTPNTAGGFSTSAYDETLRDDKASARIDGNTRLGMITGYYFVDDFTLVNPYGSDNIPGFASGNNGRAQMLNLGVTKTFGASSVNELHIGYMRDVQFSGTPMGGLGTSLASQGFTGIFPMNPSYEGVEPMGFNNYNIGVANNFLRVYDNTYNVADNFSKVMGTHTLKFGGAYAYDQVEYRFTLNLNGSFGFNGNETGYDFADFLLGAPNSYSQGLQLPVYSRARTYSLYVQDSWRAKKNLTLNYGLRWEVSSPWWEAHNEFEALIPGCQSKEFPGSPAGWCFPGDPGVPTTLSPTRYNNFAPRLGLAYSPHAESGFLHKLLGGSGETSIRAAYGIFYSSFENRIVEQESGDAPYGYWYQLGYQPDFTTPFVARTNGTNYGQRFPFPVPPLNISASNPDNSVNWAGFVPIGSSPGFQTSNRLPYAEHYNLSLQRQFGSATILSVSYVGTQGHRLLATVAGNPSNPALCESLASTGCGPNNEDAGPFTNASGQPVYSVRSPFNEVVTGLNGLTEAFASDGYISTMANSNYNSLEVTMRRTLGRAEFLAGYTWAKSLDNSSGNGLGQGDNINPFNPSVSKALSAFNVAQNFVISYSYRMPFDKLPGPKRLTDGWMLNGITRFATGFPVYILETDDYSMLGTGGVGQGNDIDEPNRVPGSLSIQNPRAEVLPNSNNPTGSNPYFNTALFPREALGQLGDANRRAFNGPGWNNFDLSITKDVRLTESMRLELRGEFFNAWNHAQFQAPQGNFNNSDFGFVTNTITNNQRIGQIGAKFIF